MGELMQETELVVIGGGPGGYAAAFLAADLGMDVTLVDISERPGGVCLFRGCIPSKTYLHMSELLHDTSQAASMGLRFSPPEIDLDAIRSHKARVVDKLADGLVSLSDRRGVQRIRGRAVFEGPDRLRVHESEVSHIKFRHAILATGSHPIPFPAVPFKKGGRVMNSTGALALAEIPDSLLVIGGGYVGLELGSVYASFGSKVSVVELGDRLLPGVDADLVKPVQRRLEQSFEAIRLNTKVTFMQEHADRVEVMIEGAEGSRQEQFDRVLVAIGRKPNSAGLGLDHTGVKTDERGFVIVDDTLRTSDERILAVGDVVGGMMLAHKATYEGKIAAEVIAGEPAAFDARAIPAVVYTDPQIAYCGLTEEEARRQDRKVEVHRFPWKFSGRATTMDATEGVTKMILDPETGRVLGVGICGRDSEGLISEGVLAVEMGALAQDLALSIHPHPTLSETEMEAAEIFTGTATHILPKRRK
ncbi:MAG: dihydrolipoamide dehydrogenase [Deltaproteobacteria bacterium SG8_13]|nr:MAG: dihydrolipoamide dehydrogenase [Deltaproteobacteria bacterium SG8_13]